MSTRAFIVIMAADKDRANALAASTFDTGGRGNLTFTAGLVPTGSPSGTAPTHFITAALFEDSKWALIPTLALQFTGSHYASYDLLSEPNAPWTYCASVGLMRPLPVIQTGVPPL